LLFKAHQDALEGHHVLGPFGTVAREVERNAAPDHLAVERLEREQVVGPEQHMHRLAVIGQRLDAVHLVLHAGVHWPP